MKNKNQENLHSNHEEAATVEQGSHHWRKVVAGLTALAITATGGVIYNRPFDPWIREQSYMSEELDGIPGTGGVGVIDKGTPASASFSTRVVAPATSKDKTFTVTDWRNRPADSTPNMGKARRVKYKLRQIEDGGWTIDTIISEGESSDYITDPNSLGKAEPETAKPQQDWSRERASVGKSVIDIALDGTQFDTIPITKDTDQDVLSKPEMKVFGKIASTLGYQTAHELTTAVLMGREARPKALKAVQKYILDEMGVTIKVKASKDTPPIIEYTHTHNPGTPPTEIPYYNPHPAAWWGQAETLAKPTTTEREPLPPRKRTITRTGTTERGPSLPIQDMQTIHGHRRPTAMLRKQPGDRNDGGNNGTRGQRSPHPKSTRTQRRIDARSNG